MTHIIDDGPLAQRLLKSGAVSPLPYRLRPALDEDVVPSTEDYLRLWYSVLPSHELVSQRLRRVFTRSSVKTWEAHFASCAQEQVDQLPRRGDLIDDYFVPASSKILFDYLGVGMHGTRVTTAIAVLERMISGSGVRDEVAHAVISYLKLLADELAESNEPGFPTALRDLKSRGVGPWELAAVLGQVLVAGRTPTVTLCAQTFLVLRTSPESTVDTAVSTALHVHPPFRYLHRQLQSEDHQVGCPVGTQLLIDIKAAQASGGVGRTLAFGLGAHRCLGENLARATARCTVAVLRDRLLVDVDLDRVEHNQTPVTRGVARLPYTSILPEGVRAERRGDPD